MAEKKQPAASALDDLWNSALADFSKSNPVKPAGNSAGAQAQTGASSTLPPAASLPADAQTKADSELLPNIKPKPAATSAAAPTAFQAISQMVQSTNVTHPSSVKSSSTTGEAATKAADNYNKHITAAKSSTSPLATTTLVTSTFSKQSSNNMKPQFKEHSGSNATTVSSQLSGHKASAPNRLRSFNLFDNRDFLPRTFQIELYEACKSRDTIVFLRPGNGKHFLTVMLVKYFIPKTGPAAGTSQQQQLSPLPSRKVFFLTKTKNSIRLYASVFRAHTDLRVHEYHEVDPELGGKLPWSYAEWQQHFTTNDIHLMVDFTFERLLQAGYLGAEHVKLLILDDVHKILAKNGDDCYTRIMRKLRASGLARNSKEYRVLGLSASILIEDVSSRVFEEMISRIENHLQCTCETYADLRMINKYSIPCRIRLHYYPSTFMDHYSGPLIDQQKLKLSLFKIRNYTKEFYLFLRELTDSKLSEQTYLVTNESLSRCIFDVLNALGTLGEWCTVKLIDLYCREVMDTIALLKATKSNYVKLLNTTFTTLQIIRQSAIAYLPKAIKEKLNAAALPSDEKKTVDHLTLEEFFFISSPKLHLLAQLLHDYLIELRSPAGSSPIQTTFTFPANICSIIYAQNRSTVRIVTAWIAQLATITAQTLPSHGFAYLLPDYVFLRDDDQSQGTSSLYTQKQQQKSLHEIFYYRRQEEVLKRFRFAHNCNLLLTTSMSAEGLDVNRCNFVVCFDPPQTFQQFIQSKGRVRTENGLFYVLIDEFDTQHKDYMPRFRQFVDIEKIFTKLVPLANDVKIDARCERKVLRFKLAEIASEKAILAPPVTPSTGHSAVQLTMENAISILNRYCLKLPSDTFTKLAPHYYIDAVSLPTDGVQLAGSSRYQCRLYLPINSTFRDEILGDPMTNRVMAKRSAAFKAVKTLQEMGELDGNFYPLGKETTQYVKKLGLEECFITTPRNTGDEGTLLSRPAHHRPGNRYNRLQARNIASKRRLYYHKKVADYLSSGECFKPAPAVAGEPTRQYLIEHLYEFEMNLSCPLPEEQNIRGRPLINPADTPRNFGIIVAGNLPPICNFTIYNRSGEVSVSLKRLEKDAGRRYSQAEIESLRTFHYYTTEGVLRLGKNSIKPEFGADASNGNFVIVPVNGTFQSAQQPLSTRGIDWDFVDLIVKHKAQQDAPKSSLEPEETPLPETFVFDAQKYLDAVVIPKYRRDKLQAFFYVAQICSDLSPLSRFPDNGFATFEEYYRVKYSLTITDLKQPLLDVDHTSTRLNLLTPRYLTRKGGMDPTMAAAISGSTAKRAVKKSQNLQQKQILVPELCIIHPFPASFWRKAVCLPCMLYRLNSLLVAEELRHKIAREANIGQIDLPRGLNWPALDFGWSLIVKQVSEDIDKLKGEEPELAQAIERSDKGYNLGGRPAESSFVPGSQPTGQVKVSSFTVDTFGLETPKVQPLVPTPPVPSEPQAAPPPPKSKGFQPLPEPDDPFAAMGDWTSFAEKVTAEKPELFQAPPPAGPQIDIISFGATDPSIAIPENFSGDPELQELINRKLKRTTEPEEPAIIEVDDKGNPIVERPMRIGSPTQFLYETDEDEDDEPMDMDGGFKADPIYVDTFTNWTAPVDSDSESVGRSESGDYQVKKFTVDLNGLSKDMENIAVCEDENFIEEITQQYGELDDAGNPIAKRTGTAAKEVTDDFEDDASYSDFDVEDMDDEDEIPDFDEEDVDLDELDDDEELGDFEDDDDGEPCYKKSKSRKGKKQGAGGGGLSKKLDPTAETDTSGYKAKSFIYDVLRYELLYDSKTFEKVTKRPQLTGGDGSELLNVDRQKRSINKRYYERIYREEKELVLLCTEKISEEMEEAIEESTELEEHQVYGVPLENENDIDRSLSEIPLSPSERFFDVVFEKFGDDLPDAEKITTQLIDEKLFKDKHMNEDPRMMMANYGPIGDASDEVKFGELLHNRSKEGNGVETPTFSFDASPQSVGPGLCLGPDPSLILQAITMSNSSDGINLERLETVGDSFLKYSITAFLFSMCPDLNEGKLSFLRSRQISNINLHRLGQRINLGQLMIASKFEPNDNWCPPGYKVIEEQPHGGDGTGVPVNKDKVPYNLLTQHSIPNKSIADCVEALIGTYLISAGSQGAIQFMDWLGLKVLPKEFRTLTKIVDTVSGFSDNRRDQWLPESKSPLISPKESSPEALASLKTKLDDIYHQKRLDRFEKAIGYTFRDKAFLVQAFTHNSYYENTVTDCYQRLEFLGDAVLDYLITRYLYEDPRCHSPGTLTDLRSALVNNTFFASLAVKYNFHKYLMMLSFELYRVVDGFVKKFNICNQNRIAEQQAREAGVEEGEVLDEEDPSKRSCVYWELFISENEAEHLEDIEVPKALGDIFESVAGAIFLDSGMSLDAVWNAYYPMMKPEIEYFSYNVPKSPIRVLLEKQPQSAKFEKPEITSGRKIRVCVEVFNVGKFVGVGRNKRIAKCTAAKRALRALKVLDDKRDREVARIRADQLKYERTLQGGNMTNFGFQFTQDTRENILGGGARAGGAN